MAVYKMISTLKCLRAVTVTRYTIYRYLCSIRSHKQLDIYTTKESFSFGKVLYHIHRNVVFMIFNCIQSQSYVTNVNDLILHSKILLLLES